MAIEYVYLPNYDGDEGSVWAVDEVFYHFSRDCQNDLACGFPLDQHRTTDDFTPEDTEDAAPAELVVAMDLANHGQDLTADFILEAVELLEGKVAPRKRAGWRNRALEEETND